mmetsp:Transcript_25456/g.37608  ORF Transcript_25456/g.37608 Transcript_25456/m.37608 type:complete len:361 (+) Transcript_25456:58-1140(+)
MMEEVKDNDKATRPRSDSTKDDTSDDEDITQSHQGKWEIMFQRLNAFRLENGHCLVPNRYKKDHRLGSWVSTQRRQYKAFAAGKINTTTLSMDRIRKLESIGFAWCTDDPRRVDWYVRFKQLCLFQKEWGHTLVPMGYKKNPSLGNWVSVQRQEFRNMQQGKSSKMTPNRVKLLESIGFIWKAPRGARRKNEKAPLSHPNIRAFGEDNVNDALGSVANMTSSVGSTNFGTKSLDSLRGIDSAADLANLQQQQLLNPYASGMLQVQNTRSILLQRAALRYKREVLQLLDPQMQSLLDERRSSIGSADDLSTAAALKLANAGNPMQQNAFLDNSSLLGHQPGALPSVGGSERLAQLLLQQYR